MSPALPLAGFRVLTFENFGAGPFGSMYLADLGAEVIKIENRHQGGDATRGMIEPWAGKPLLHIGPQRDLGLFDGLDVRLVAAEAAEARSQAEIAALFTAHGVAEADFIKAFNSFGVSSQVRQAGATSKAAQITGTPALMVNGKYHVSGSKAGGQANMLKVVDFLIEKERAAKGN